MNCLALLCLLCPSCDPEGMSREQLDALFAAGRGDRLPLGVFDGKVFYLAEAKRPKLRLASMNAAWKGKTFRCDGSFVNRWIGFEAIVAQSSVAPSWFDGKPAVVVDYEPGTPVFGKNRDEIREVAPGVWLARLYKRDPCGKFDAYFVLRAKGCCR